jgi:hypothetical protein
MALVIKEWFASEEPNDNGDYVYLSGREGGLVSWLLSVFGIDPTSEVKINNDLIRFDTSSLAGVEKRIIPLASVSSASYAYKKPWKVALLLITIALGLLSISGWFIIFLAVGPVYYFLNKSLTIDVLEVAGKARVFSFKRSVIEGQDIGEEDAYKVIDLIRKLIEKKTT